jgi:hypothetical protein
MYRRLCPAQAAHLPVLPNTANLAIRQAVAQGVMQGVMQELGVGRRGGGGGGGNKRKAAGAGRRLGDS